MNKTLARCVCCDNDDNYDDDDEDYNNNDNDTQQGSEHLNASVSSSVKYSKSFPKRSIPDIDQGGPTQVVII